MTDTLIQEAAALGEELLPVLGGFIIEKLDPSCDLTGAKTALTGLAGNLAALVTALETKTVSSTATTTEAAQ
ncbi:hypothetical protein [Acidomonas methanolica]|uniref:Uncharacterized protein n=1 Tax=Acidomonas methanolica NBRC 104435 TaxID=1231351 RepID=A0A023D6P5_ACIMT|nr:hypothetical protein [Acidomonas methanolica]TCS24099.1 hypothetical protein EDC31_12520 [Acidomonas methanolica]GAJ29749.1 hypothetical protein Amme_076_042 [Acidomonas methanolica NBRC 104435]GBQ59380.1 hypothetical protein AA0498_2740 [Acidomonas methanolica]GEL00014.1 hypothetical protein AME01nite_25120 [Acidomonas methanolica NBRC 104435]